MESKKDSIIFYHRQIDKCRRHLNHEQFGRLMEALFDFDKGEDPEVDDDISIAFDLLSLQNEIDRDKYERKCATNRKNGALGGRPKKNPTKPNGFFKNPNENENDNVNENVNVNEADDTDFYGTLHNVELAKGEFEHLKATYERWGELIDKVSTWLPNAKGSHNDDHFALCLKFANNDNWPKKKKIEPAELPEVLDPLPDEEHDAKVAELKKTLNGMFEA